MSRDLFTCPPFDTVHDHEQYQTIVVVWHEAEKCFMKAVCYEDLESFTTTNLFQQLKSYNP